jgi:hypothetical protein
MGQEPLTKLQVARKQRAQSRIKELQSVVHRESRLISLKEMRDTKKRMKSIERGEEET